MARHGQWVKKWEIESESNSGKRYIVSLSETGVFGCSCPQWKFRRGSLPSGECKHIQQVKATGMKPTLTAVTPRSKYQLTMDFKVLTKKKPRRLSYRRVG